MARVIQFSTLPDREKDKFYQFFVDEGIEVGRPSVQRRHRGRRTPGPRVPLARLGASAGGVGERQCGKGYLALPTLPAVGGRLQRPCSLPRYPVFAMPASLVHMGSTVRLNVPGKGAVTAPRAVCVSPPPCSSSATPMASL